MTGSYYPETTGMRLAPRPITETIHQRFVLAAVYLDHRPIHHMHQRRGKHRDEVRHLLYLGDATERDGCGRELVGFLVGNFHVPRHGFHETRPSLGAHRAGIHCDETDVVPAVLAGQRERQVLPCRIGRSGADFPIGRLDAIVADEIDDAAAALTHHDRQHIAQATDVTHELELKAFFPILFGEMLDDAARRGARVVDHDVDTTERLVSLFDESSGI